MMGRLQHLLLRRLAHSAVRICITRVLVDAPLDLGAEVAQQTLDGPCGAIAERTDCMTLDLLCHLHQHVDLALLRAAIRHTGQYAPHPSHALAAWRALAAAFMLVEIRDAGHRTD